MGMNFASRRDILKSLGTGLAAGSVLQAIPLEAAEYVHRLIAEEKAASPNAQYVPKYFAAAQYKLLCTLCGTILPGDADSGGAVEAGAPEYIDLLTSENAQYQQILGGGLMWLDSACSDRYGNAYLECTQQQQTEMLDLMAYRRNLEHNPDASHAIEFFALLRKLTADGFFTSKIGIEYLGYVGNAYLLKFEGCPPVPGV
jgi:hypothetical protein